MTDAQPIDKGAGGAVPPQGVRAACRRGLDLAPKFGGAGLTAGAKARARAMAGGQSVTRANLGRMVNFFSRHRGNRADPSAAEPTPGAVAWLLWGGDAGARWAASQVARIDGQGRAQKSGAELLTETKIVYRAAMRNS